MSRWEYDCEEFERHMEAFEQLDDGRKKQEFLEACCKELAARLLAKVIPRTPVGIKPEDLPEKAAEHWDGYLGGTLRRGWTGGQRVSGRAYAQSLPVQKDGTDYIIEVKNPVDYASYVEFGHRQRAGRYVPALGKKLKAGWVYGKFFLTISEEEVREIAPALLEKRLMQELKKVFGND